MAFLTVKVANASGFSNGEFATVTGKNGFNSVIGSVPILVNSYSLVDVAGNSAGNIEFTVSTLDNLKDDNFNKHLLETNDNTFSGLKGSDFLAIPIEEKTNTGALLGFVGHNARLTQYSANIVGNNVTAGTLKVENIEATGSTNLIDTLPTAPFYAKLAQIVDSRFFSNNVAFVEGSRFNVTRTTNSSQLVGHNGTFDLGVVPRNKIFITLYVDEIELTRSSFSWSAGSNTIQYTLTGTENRVRTVVDHYTVPAIEVGDNVSAFALNTYSITETSYSPESANYNAALTSNCVYKIRLRNDLTANFTGVTITNISPDIEGFTGNVNFTANTFTVDYDEKTFPGNFDLGNNKIYHVSSTLDFKRVSLGQDKIIQDVPNGFNIVRARNINSTGRISPYSTQSITISSPPVQRVKNLQVSEALYKDTTQGIAIRAEISFDRITNQEVVAYEISYKLSGADVQLTNFNTVEVPAIGVGDDGKMRYTINDIERGSTAGVNEIIVKVTPITSTDIRGVSTQISSSIQGKLAAPQNVIALTGGQQDINLIFEWQYPTNADGTLVDIDLNEVVIRRAFGEISSGEFGNAWTTAVKVATVATPASNFVLPVTSFTEDTYLFRTRDTSGILSEDISGLTITADKSKDLAAFKTWSEDDPSTPVIVGIPNDNDGENNYPSFNDSNNGGLSGSGTSAVDNANGTSSGWAVIGGEPTDISAEGNAFYQTQVRNIGQEISGIVFISAIGDSSTKTTFNEFRVDFTEGATENISQANVLVDVDAGGIGHILGFSNGSAATVSFDANNRTLVSGGTSGNVFAIWNEGQFANDISNSNTYALIAGTINVNAIALGETFFANGMPTNGNTLPNLVSNSISYKLVDLSQFSDLASTITFEGETDVTSTNLEIRYANGSVSPFYANSNVNSAAFIGGATNEGWREFTSVDKNFQHFQVRLNLTNDSPGQVDFILDKLNYEVDARIKSFEKIVSINSHPFAVNYASTGFINPPSISLAVVANTNLQPVVVEHSKDEANIAVFDGGTANTNVDVIFGARGI